MGIHGIYKEIGPGKRIALSKLSVEHYIQHSRPLRLAIDISIWLFQIQSGKGGSNPALRTFYYRLLRLLSLNIHPLFVFDGPNKPPFKRNKRVGGPNVKVSSIPEFLAKQLLKQFGFPMHMAPGEAEAECALLQREGIVDAVLSEDVDTLMFGSGLTLRSWTPELKSSKVPTHVNVYDANVTKDGSGLDREGMILIALMSGGDYIPEGIPGCGPKTACEAARAGFGADLCKIKKRDDAGFKVWRERLQYELRTNESKHFRQKKTALVIPDDFPNREVLGYYTNPCISGPDKITKVRETLTWDIPLDFPSLRDFTADAFDWRCLGGAKKFVRNLAPALLIRELRLRAERGDVDRESLEQQETTEARLVTAIHGKRTHASTDSMVELRISFTPLNLVDIDLNIEEPDEELSTQDGGSDSETPAPGLGDEADPECPLSPRKRGPSTYDPTVMEKLWVVDPFLRLGAPLKVQDWEASFRDPKAYLLAKKAAKDATKPKKTTKKDSNTLQRGALDRFTRVTKIGVSSQPGGAKAAAIEEVDLDDVHELVRTKSQQPSSQSAASVYRANTSRPALVEIVPSCSETNARPRRQAKRPSPEPTSPAPPSKARAHSPVTRQQIYISLLSSPELTPRALYEKPLPDTVTKRRKRSPFRRHHTAPNAGEEAVSLSPTYPRPSTPLQSDTIEVLDLTSTATLTPSRRFHGKPQQMQDRQDVAAIPAMTAAEIASPTAKPCRDIPEWIRRSQSVTPGKTRHADVFTTQKQPIVSTTEQAIGEADESDNDPESTYHGVSSYLPAMRRFRDRSNPLSLSDASVATPDKTTRQSPNERAPTRRSPRLEQITHVTAAYHDTGRARSTAVKGTRVTKRYIQLRASLDGAWKEVEGAVSPGDGRSTASSLLPTVSNQRSKGKGPVTTRWRKSEIEVLDLSME